MSETAHPRRLVANPFPELVYGKYDYWTCRDILPSWAGFQTRLGPYDSKSSDNPSDGSVEIMVKVPSKDAVPASEQSYAYQISRTTSLESPGWFLEAIVDYFYSLAEIRGFDESEKAKHLARVRGPDDFKRLIGLGVVHILPVWKDDIAYIGFEFGCSWDSEHGLGVMMHKDRVVTVGEASHLFGNGSLAVMLTARQGPMPSV